MAELSAAADGELATGRRAALEAHTAGCPAGTAGQSPRVTQRITETPAESPSVSSLVQVTTGSLSSSR